MNDLCLRTVEKEDFSRLSVWLEKDYVQKWYHDSAEWMEEIENKAGTYDFISHWIIVVNGVTVGFCQYYDCYDAGEDWYTVAAPGQMFSIDYLIGEESFLHQGYGRKTVLALVEKIWEEHPGVSILAQPEKENQISQATLKSAGFLYDSEKEYYVRK